MSKLSYLVTLIIWLFHSTYAGFSLAQSSNITFKKHVLTTQFIAEGAAIGDVNQDGLTDVMAGAYWFEAPKWESHELEVPTTFEYDKGYSNAFISEGMDVNLDGWIDFVRIGFPGEAVLWFENPKNKKGHWQVHTICPSLGNESAGFFDVDRDGRKDLVGSIPETGEMVWFKAPSDPGNLVWEKFIISEKESPGTARYAHGLGMGDLNNDGNADLIITEGWWESPENPKMVPWKFHAVTLGAPAAQMYVQDLNGDGRQDVISSSAHELGIWWHEQKPSGEWETHLIDDHFTQSHGLALMDMDGNGTKDLVTGKRFFAHMGKDPGGNESPLLAWYEYHPGKAPKWIRHIIDDDSGVGVQVVVADFFGNESQDIILANKKGVFIFEQIRK
jgi:hypothetical protein